MIDAATDARQAVGAWLRLEVDDPAHHDARDTIASLGREVLERARGTTLGTGAMSTADDSLAGAIDELRSEIRDLEPGGADDGNWFGRIVARIPGAGSPKERRARRLASARPHIESMLSALEDERAVRSRDNVTLRVDLDRLHDLEAALDAAVGVAEAYVDALEFAVDVEVPELDPRRGLFEDELLSGARRRVLDLERARGSNRERLDAIGLAIEANRSAIREIEALTRTARNRLENR